MANFGEIFCHCCSTLDWIQAQDPQIGRPVFCLKATEAGTIAEVIEVDIDRLQVPLWIEQLQTGVPIMDMAEKSCFLSLKFWMQPMNRISYNKDGNV